MPGMSTGIHFVRLYDFVFRNMDRSLAIHGCIIRVSDRSIATGRCVQTLLIYRAVFHNTPDPHIPCEQHWTDVCIGFRKVEVRHSTRVCAALASSSAAALLDPLICLQEFQKRFIQLPASFCVQCILPELSCLRWGHGRPLVWARGRH